MTPDQLRRVADKLAKSIAWPCMSMAPGDFVASLAVHGLARALREVADEDEA